MYIFVFCTSVMFSCLLIPKMWCFFRSTPSAVARRHRLRSSSHRSSPTTRTDTPLQPLTELNAGTTSYDFVVVSDGQLHRVLVAAVLSKCGYRVALLEQRKSLGRTVTDQGVDVMDFSVDALTRQRGVLAFLGVDLQMLPYGNNANSHAFEEVHFDNEKPPFIKRLGAVVNDLQGRFPNSRVQQFVSFHRTDRCGTVVARLLWWLGCHRPVPPVDKSCHRVLVSGVDDKYCLVGGVAPVVKDLLDVIRGGGGDVFVKTTVTKEKFGEVPGFVTLYANHRTVPIVCKRYVPVVPVGTRGERVFVANLLTNLEWDRKAVPDVLRLLLSSGSVQVHRDSHVVVRTNDLEQAQQLMSRYLPECTPKSWKTVTNPACDSLDAEIDRGIDLLHNVLEYGAIERLYRDIEKELQQE